LEFTVPDYGEYFVYLRNLNKCWFFKCYDPVLKGFITTNVFTSKLNRAFENISQLDGFQLLSYTADEYGYPKEMGNMKMACYGNAEPRNKVLEILSTIPKNLLKIDHRDANDKVTRYYLEKGNNGIPFLMQTFIGHGGNDLCVWLFTGASYEYYQNFIQQVMKELNE